MTPCLCAELVGGSVQPGDMMSLQVASSDLGLVMNQLTIKLDQDQPPAPGNPGNLANPGNLGNPGNLANTLSMQSAEPEVKDQAVKIASALDTANSSSPLYR